LCQLTARAAARPQPRRRHLPRAPPRGRSLSASALSQQPTSGCGGHRAAAATPCVTVIFPPPLVSNLKFLYSRHLFLAATFGSCVHCCVPGQALAGGSVLGLGYRFPDLNVVLSRASRQPQVRPCGSSRPMSVPRLWVHPSVECPESRPQLVEPRHR
jgi:hypothetical protein